MILPLASDMITLEKIKIIIMRKCIMKKEEKVYYDKEEKRRKRNGIKFGMTSIPLRHALLGITL